MITAKFSKSFNDVLTKTYLFHSGLVKDLASFAAFSPIFTSDYASDFLDLIEDKGELLTNEEDLNNKEREFKSKISD